MPFKIQIADNSIYSIHQMDRLAVITVKPDAPIEEMYKVDVFNHYFEHDLKKTLMPEITTRLFIFSRNCLAEQRFNVFYRTLKKEAGKRAYYQESNNMMRSHAFSLFVNIKHRFIREILASNKLNIFALDGSANGMWLSTILAGEFSMLSSDTQFTFPFVKDDIIPLGGLNAYLGSTMPKAVLNELLLLGQPLDAKQLLDWGLVNRIYPYESFIDKTITMASMLSHKSPAFIRNLKRFRFNQNADLMKCLELEQKYYA